MSDLIAHACTGTHPHDPHVWVSFIAGGPPGPVPQLTLMCPGHDEFREEWRA